MSISIYSVVIWSFIIKSYSFNINFYSILTEILSLVLIVDCSVLVFLYCFFVLVRARPKAYSKIAVLIRHKV